MVVVLCILLTFPNWHEEIDDKGSERDVKPFPNREATKLAIALLITASWLAVLSMLWEHVASVAAVTTIENMAYGTVKGKIGAAGLILGWLAVAMIMIGTFGLVVMAASIHNLDILTDDFDDG